MKYIQVKFTAEPDSQDARDIIAALAAEVGFDSFTDEPDGLVGYCQEDLFNKETLTEIIQSLPIPDVKVSFEAAKAEDKNWNEEWEKAGFDPIIIDNRCAIICKNMEEDATATYPQLETIPMKIAIDAQQAFGTGTHETTQMIVSLLLNQDLKEKRVLDCGCGTGILGIVAAKCGAKEVVSYDIDEWSVRNAEHNAELNGVELDVLEGDRRVFKHVSGVFDVILANINRNIILEDIDEFVNVMTTESKIILSGFYEQDAEAILQKANEHGLKENQRLLNHDWCCLLLERQ
ncbi:50S ribosomal protein L11 methyltransferase [Prevotella melaninogenica]|uniref:Ribosomal protein L11 methyltransferase n=1 Tax=Prevotella melaninogenica DNF00666 TaxID=1401073 RepID=A0A096AKL1_9BACT|nr:50S ribosomal protein L11 methyltransferase [Prevotella melaninogenica]KGF47638.1 ribosomal protein L11 methyltransferase [Prevotella melaninogenica DNF00666]